MSEVTQQDGEWLNKDISMTRKIFLRTIRSSTLAAMVVGLTSAIAVGAAQAESISQASPNQQERRVDVAQCWTCEAHYNDCVGNRALVYCVRDYVNCRARLCHGSAAPAAEPGGRIETATDFLLQMQSGTE